MNQDRLPRFFLFISYLYLTLMLADQVLMYRMVKIGEFYLTAGVFLMPLYYFTGDMIAEVYGFRIARNLVVLVVLCSIIFAIIITILNHLPIPPDWTYKQAYEQVLGRLLRSTVGGAAIALLGGSYLNVYILSKLKIMVKGKFFILRSIGSSAFGEAIQMIIGCVLLFSGIMPFDKLLRLMVELYIWQVGLGGLVSTCGAGLVKRLKQIDGEVSDTQVNFNPFKNYAKTLNESV